MNKDKQLFVDTDCLSCFLYTNKGSLIQKLFPNYQIMIPHAVATEMEANRKFLSKNLKKKKLIRSYDFALDHNYFQVMDDFDSESDEFYLVMQLTGKGYDGGPSIGIGESQVIAAAFFQGGVIASNNLRDINYYTNKLRIKNWTASDLLYKAYNEKIEDEETISTIWNNLIDAGYKMPTSTFQEFKTRKEK